VKPLGRLLPGVGVLVGIAGAAVLLAAVLPLVTALVVAIAIGAAVTNTIGFPAWAEPGLGTHPILLEAGIVLLGAQLSLGPLFATGPLVLGLVVTVVVAGLAIVTAVARVVDLDEGLTPLLAAGSSICGVSAIAAVAPVCDAEDRQIAHAAATIVLFDVATLLAFPVVGSVLELDARFFGVWVGLAMFSTGPVAAAGFAHSATAGQWATVTKLARNTFIGVVALWYSIRALDESDGRRASLRTLWAEFPLFLIGFLVVIGVTNAGLLPAPAVEALATGSDVLFLLAFAGLGADIRLRGMAGSRSLPVAVVGANLLAVAGLSYVLLSFGL
jgi:uncharacterized integral membrane protein (TIGR00698 family)